MDKLIFNVNIWTSTVQSKKLCCSFSESSFEKKPHQTDIYEMKYVVIRNKVIF